jgi:peptide/nickel transport system permease protein
MQTSGKVAIVDTPVVDPTEAAFQTRSMLAITYQRLKRSKSALAGFVLVVALVLVAALADVIAPADPAQIFPGQAMQFPSTKHLMGTDQIGRDVFSRVVYGARISILIGFSSIILAMLVGVPLGIASGYYGGTIDFLVMRVMDLIMAFPIFLLAIIAVVAIRDLIPPTFTVVIALGIVRVPIYARIVRGSVLSVKENDYIEAVRALALKDRRILFRHLLPNCMAPLIVTGTLSIGTAIVVEASLSFLGLGTQPPTPSWGYDLKASVSLIQINPWLSIFPGTAILLTVLGFNLFGDGLRDALDPRLKQ